MLEKTQTETQKTKNRLSHRGYRIGDGLKRAFDVVIAFFGLLLLSPIFAAIAIWIKRDSPGPVYYRGKRSGKDEKLFDILKFRTMYETPASYAGPKITGQDDPRITPMGKWLRHTKLNELPQLLNVLKGEMSLVGPRPEDPDIVSTWSEDERGEILSVRPGITSPASVLYRDEEHQLQNKQVMDTYLKVIAPDKQRLDQLYVRNRSFLLDMDVLLWTFLVLLPKIGQFKPPEHFLFLGPISRFVGRYLNWFVIDTLVSLVAISISGLVWRSITPLNIGWQRAILASIGFAMLFSLFGSLFGVQRVEWSRARGSDAIELIFPAIFASLIALGLNSLILGERRVPMEMVLFASGLSLLGFVFVRYRSRLLRSFSVRFLRNTRFTRAAHERIIILGGGRAGEMAAHILRQIIGSTDPFEIVGFIDDDLYKQGARIAGLPVLGNSQNIEQLVTEHDIGVLVFAIHNVNQVRRNQLINICAQFKVKVVILPDILQGFSSAIGANGKLHIDRYSAAPLIAGWPGIASGQVDAWLSILEEYLRKGNTEDALFQIENLRQQLANIEHEDSASSMEQEESRV